MGLVVGLTGGIGAGKSTVAALFAQRGAYVVDVDALGREVLEPDGAAYERVVEIFGSGVLAADDSIDRPALAAAVFGAENRLAELEAISHPAINHCLATLVGEAMTQVVVLDMAVLVESELGQTDEGPLYHRVVVVEAAMELRIDRLVKRGLNESQARKRMAAQATDAERRAVADLIVLNDGPLEDLTRTVETVWPTIKAWQTQVGR